MAKDMLDDEQKATVRKIVEWSNTLGLDPHLALGIAFNESGLKNIPASDEKSTAFGPFQVNKATAEANGVEYEKMKDEKNPDLAIWTGLANLARHAQNPVFEGDPARILAAHRWGENSPFAATGDPSAIPAGGQGYLRSVGVMFPGEDFPKSVYAEPPPYSREGVSARVASELIDEVGGGGGDGVSIADKISNLPLPVQAAATSAVGAGLGAMGAAPQYIKYRKAMAILDAYNALMDKEKGPTGGKPPAGAVAGSAAVEPPAASTAEGAPTKGGVERWLAGRTTDLTAVPKALTEGVTTLKGDAPGSASHAEAVNAANIQKQIGIGEPLKSWQPQTGGQILLPQTTGGGTSRTFTEPTPEQVAQGQTTPVPKIGGKPAPLKVPPPPPAAAPPAAPAASSEVVPSSFRKAVEYAKATAKNPITNAMMFGGSIGAAVPYAAADWVRGDYEGAMKKLAIGTGVGATLAVAPSVGKVVAPLAAVAQGYDTSQRAQAKDYVGAGLSAAGTTGALAAAFPKLAPKFLPPAVGATLAVGAPLANLARDLARDYPDQAAKLSRPIRPPFGRIRGEQYPVPEQSLE